MKKNSTKKTKTDSKNEPPQKALTLEEFFGLFDPEIVAEFFGPQGYLAKQAAKADASKGEESIPTKGIMPDYPTGDTLFCDVTLEVIYVGGTSSVEPSQRITFPCPLPPPGLGVAGIPIAIGELKRIRARMWEEAKKMVAVFEKKPKVDWVRFHKVQYQTNKTDPTFTTDFIRKFVLADPGHSNIPADF